MYKVFYQDRVIYLTEDFSSSFANNYGLFYKFYDTTEMKELLLLFSYITSIKKLYIFHNKLEQLHRQFRSCFTNITAAGGLVRNTEGNILFIKRKGKWDLPKGKAEKNESPEETALREITEETGINKLKITGPLMTSYHIYQQGTELVLKKNLWFDVETSFIGEPVPETKEEITEAIWFEPEDVPMILGNTYLSIIDILKERKLLPY